MGRLLATVSGREMPGFEPFAWDDEVVTNPLKDPERVYWIDVTRRRMLYTSEQLAQARREAVEALQVPFLIDVESFRAEQEKAAQVRFARNLVQAPLDWNAYSNLRWPSDLALVLAAEMRREGRPLEALALAARYGRDMTRASDTSSWFLLSQIQQAKAEMQQGSAYTDLDEPLRAEESLLRGVERIESLIATLKTRGMAARVVAQAEEQLARLLSSLAVNANVKLGQPERAVAWVERAHELSANGASTVLLACYRARAGRLDEARDLLRRASPEPGMEYNLACTHALLGNREAALDWLRRSLDQSGTSPGELRREKDWAARDPDLGSLRDDPRFAALVQ
jgi:tetratricopeptide (TPR) repeat protein